MDNDKLGFTDLADGVAKLLDAGRLQRKDVVKVDYVTKTEIQIGEMLIELERWIEKWEGLLLKG